ncbi:hypothetical protein LSCM1_02887 [Leishmania martiniquensis]|uniref:MRH domain-containing protein n=1 Tax=Leishmania martiniquensis TaxID=1580590 RepID=A0A836HCR0_9TRYP|nr:hypothetical protein LSCM1_02887 [Leishmania martiniquensis]
MRQSKMQAFRAGSTSGKWAGLAGAAVAFLLLVLQARGAAARPCTSSDIMHFFSPCNKLTGKLTVLSYLNTEADCDLGDLVVPPPRSTACYNCSDGQQLDPMTLECVACPAGTYSSYMTRYDSFDPLPEGVSTFCNPEPCEFWSPVEETYGTVISSGLQPTEGRPVTPWGTVDESVQSTLDFAVLVTESSGSLEFDYSVSSEEYYDGLVLRLNFSVVRNSNREVGKYRFFATGVHRDWYHAAIELPHGLTQIQFEYLKDSSGPPYGEELIGVNDRALLRNIVVKGTHKTVAEVQCTGCPPGHWTAPHSGDGGAFQCVRCPRNTYRSANDSQCTQCPPGTSSPEGATSCARMRSCTASDYIAQYGSCQSDGRRVRNWAKYPGVNCMEEAGSRPSSSRVECAACLPGMRHEGGRASGACVGCAAGEYLSGNRCRVCPTGTAAIPRLIYRGGFDALGGNLSALSGTSMSYQHCAGAESTCQTKDGVGFELVGLLYADEDNTVIGIRQQHFTNSTYSRATFNYTFRAEEDGWVNLTFAYVDNDGNYMESLDWRTTMNVRLVVDGEVDYPVGAFATRPGKVGAKFFSLAVPYYVETALPETDSDSKSRGLRHRFSWIVEELAYTSSPISVVIVALEVFGDVSGGVQSCQPCRAGYSCAARASKMSPCAPGTVQRAKGAQQCTVCGSNTYSPGYGFTTCLSCPSNTVANDDHTGCSSACVFKRNGVLYNFSELRGAVLNATRSYIHTANSSLANMTVEEADEADITRFYFSPCDPLPVADARTTSSSAAAVSPVTRDRLCVPSKRTRNSSLSAYLCQRTSATNGYHFGDAVTHLEAGLHFFMVTQMGSPLTLNPVLNSQMNTERALREAYIELQCSTKPDEPRIGTLQFIGESNEETILRWRSAYACPICTNESYEKVETTCDDPTARTRRVYYTLRPRSFGCVGGYVPPDPVIIDCTECTRDSYTVRWLECNESTKTQEGVYVLIPERSNCTPSSTPLPPVKPRACQPSSAGRRRSAAAVAVLLLILGALLAVMSVMAVNYRRMRELVARAARGEGAELDAYGGMLDDTDGQDAEDEAPEASPPANDRATAPVQQLWGVVVGMGQHIRDAVSPNDGSGGGQAAADVSADAQNNWNGYNFLGASDGGSSEGGGGSGSAQNGERGHTLFTLAADDDDLLPGPR